MASLAVKGSALKAARSSYFICARSMSGERFGVADGASGWKWENNGIGMGGKDAGVATQAKPTMGKNKEYKVPEYFEFNNYSYFDIEKQIVDTGTRVTQPKSGMTEFW